MPLVALGTWRGSYKDCADNDFICFRERARTAVGSWLEIGGTHIDGARLRSPRPSASAKSNAKTFSSPQSAQAQLE